MNTVPAAVKLVVEVSMRIAASAPTVSDSVVVPEGPNDCAFAAGVMSAATAITTKRSCFIISLSLSQSALMLNVKVAE